MPIHLHVVCSYCCVIAAELQSCDKICVGSQSQKYLLSLYRKSFLIPDLGKEGLSGIKCGK